MTTDDYPWYFNKLVILDYWNTTEGEGVVINLVDSWVDFGSSYESVDINNQVTLILTQLNHWFDFAASGITYIGLPQPWFDPDYDPNDGSGGSESGQSLIYGNNDSEDVQVEYPLIFSGLYSNTTFQEF